MQILQNDPRCQTVREVHRHATPALDFTMTSSISECVRQLALEDRFHLIILATGVLHGAHFGPEKKWGDLDLATMEAVFRVNALGPAALMSGLLECLDRERGLMMILSAKVGSIEDNRLGGWYSYRASKAALNMFIKTASIELKRKQAHSVLVAMHPGTVSSPLSKPFGGDELGRPALVAAGDMLGVLDGLSPLDSGAFVSYKGERLPW